MTVVIGKDIYINNPQYNACLAKIPQMCGIGQTASDNCVPICLPGYSQGTDNCMSWTNYQKMYNEKQNNCNVFLK